MALSDFFSNFHLFSRWFHVFFGIIWIGHLYFFNWVNIPFQASIDDATKKGANAQLLSRALWWFRWGAMMTLVAGLVLFTMNYMYTPGIGFGPTNLFQDAYGITGRAWWIMFGMLLGLVMWFNVWFIIWPSQQRILGLCGKPKAEGDALAALRKKAGLFSKVNTFLSAPMLLAMLAAPHYGAINPLTLLVFVAVTVLFVWANYKHSTKVGKPA